MKIKNILVLGLLLIIGLALTGCDSPLQETPSPDTVTAPAAEGIIVCMGDSLTAGYGVDEAEAYPALLEARLRSDGFAYQVINAGVSGETSSGALSRLDWMLTLHPDIVILETGANDGLRGIDPDLTRGNIAAIVAKLEAGGVGVVLAGMQMVRNLGPVFTDKFRTIYPEIARASGVILIPFFLEGVAGQPELNQADGIHPTAKGYHVVTDHIYPYIAQAIEHHRNLIAGNPTQ